MAKSHIEIEFCRQCRYHLRAAWWVAELFNIQDVDGTFTAGSGTATGTGNLVAGTPITGSDED